MKKLIILWLSIVAFTNSCTTVDDEEEVATYNEYSPVLMTRENLETSIKFQEAHSLQSIAKMYTYGDIIFISEKYKGVHVIDNTDPKNPQNKGFIQIPGCIDVAFKNNILYVSSSTDLVALDLTDYENPVEIGRQRDVFPQLESPSGYYSGTYPENAIVIEWNQKTSN